MLIKHLRKYGAYKTTGLLFIDGKRIAETIEDIGRPDGIKINKETCLPEGLYNVTISHSPAFGRPMILLFTNPQDFSCELGNIRFTGIRVHYGEKTSHTEGCVCIPSNKDLSILFGMIQAALGNGDQVLWEITRDDPPVSLAA